MVGSLEEEPECGGGATQGGPLAPGALAQHGWAEGEIALARKEASPARPGPTALRGLRRTGTPA